MSHSYCQYNLNLLSHFYQFILVDDTTKISKIWFMLDSGFMKVRCEGWSRLRDLTTIDRYSGIDSQIGVGWNMISYTDTGSGFKFRTSKYFQTFTSNSALYFTYTDGNIGILGGYRSGNMSFDYTIKHKLICIRRDDSKLFSRNYSFIMGNWSRSIWLFSPNKLCTTIIDMNHYVRLLYRDV